MRLFFLAVLITTVSIGHAQTTVLKTNSINQMLELVKKQDSIPAYKGEEKRDEAGAIYNVSTLPPMGKFTINIQEYPKQPKPYSFYLEIPVTKLVNLASLKKEIKGLVKSKAIKGSWKADQDNEFSLYYISTDHTAIHLIKDISGKFVHLTIYNIEGQE